ncbi:endospore germination permease (plasmid) [Bacillus sp. F19]|nr:endospore germination permease [Bacillus sp. F19]
MLEKGKISPRQFSILVTFFTVGGSILFVPTLTFYAKQDAWIAYLLGAGIGLLFVLLNNTLGSIFPNMTIAEYSEVILGKWLGKIVSLLYFIYFFIICVHFLRQMGNFLTTHILNETPIVTIHIIFFIVVIMGVRLGLETLARGSEIFLPWITLLFFVFIVSLVPQMKFNHLQPLLENKLLYTVYLSIDSPYTQLVTFLMIFPYVNQIKKAEKSFYFGTLSGFIILFLILIVSILVLGADHSARQIYPSYSLAKKINVGNFIQRIEAVIMIIWLVTLYYKVTIIFYAATLCLGQILKLKDHRPLTFPLGMVIVVYSIVSYPNIISYSEFANTTLGPLTITFGLILPLLLLVIGKYRFSWKHQ